MRVWINGDVRPAADAAVSVFDHGLTVGDGVFETMKVIDGRPFALTRHLRRLATSARRMGLSAPDDTVVRTAVADVLAANAEALGLGGRLRLTYTAGPGPMGSERGDGSATLIAIAVPATPWQPTTAVATVPWPRNERGALTGVKSTSYAENVIALADARRRGASEAVLANTVGQLCEGTGSNVFVVIDGELLTPDLGSGCLAGITRELVVQWCGAIEVALPIDVLTSAEEVFITSSTRDVHPVHRVDDRHLPAPGPVTAACRETFARRSADDIDP